MGDNRVQPDPTIEALQAENALLLEQLHRIQEELEHYALGNLPNRQSDCRFRDQANTTTTEGGELHTGLPLPPRPAVIDSLHIERQARKRAQRRRDAILESTSWQLTAPLRWLRRPLSGAKPASILLPPTEPTSFDEEQKARRRLEAEISDLMSSTSWRIMSPIRSLRRQRAGLEKQLTEYQGTCERLTEESDHLRKQLVASEKELTERRTAAQRQAAKNNQLREQLAEREQELAKQRAKQVSESDQLRQQLTEREQEVAQQRGTAESRAAENRQLRQQLNEREQEVAQQRGTAESRAAENRQLSEQLITIGKQLTQERTSGERRTAETLQLKEQVASLQSALAGARSDLSITIRLNAQREIDLAELQNRYAESIDVRDQQHALLVKLRQRLGEAAT